MRAGLERAQAVTSKQTLGKPNLYLCLFVNNVHSAQLSFFFRRPLSRALCLLALREFMFS